MKRTMKKSLSMLLVFAMVFGMFSWMPVQGYAEGELDSLPLGASGIAITSPDSYTCKEGEGGTFRVTATGTDYIEFTLSGEPEGVSLDDTGLLTIADTVEAGEYIFDVTASDMDGIADSDTQDFTLTVEPGGDEEIPTGDHVVITSADSFICHAGEVGTFQITATGADNIEFSLLGEPDGVTLDATGLMTIADTVEAGEYIFDITASDMDGVAEPDSRSFTLTVESEPPVAGRITITSEAAYVCGTGEGGTFQITATGADNIEFSLLGEPEGVTLDDTGLLTVADTVEAGEYSFTVTANDADGIAEPDSQSFTLAVHGAVPFMPLTLMAEGDVCRIGETYYSSIETAVEEAKTGDVITLVDYITLRGSLVVDGKSIIINCDRFALMIDYYTAVGFSEGGAALLVKNGGSLKIFRSEEGYPDPGLLTVYADIGVKAESGGQAEIVGGGIYGVKYGLWADGADSVIIVHGPVQSEVNDIDQDIIHDRHGAYTTNGGRIAINGNVTSANYGVVAEGKGSSITVTEDVVANKEGTAKISDNSAGALAKDGGEIIIGGDVTGSRYGAYAEGKGSKIYVENDAVAASENEPQGSGYGVYAIQGAYVELGGEAKGYNSGVMAETGGRAAVENATGTGPYSIGAYIGEDSIYTDTQDGEPIEAAATIIVRNDAKGSAYGALAENFGTITVAANAIGTENAGASASGGGVIAIDGDATGYAFGVYAKGEESKINVGGNAVATSETEPQGSGYGVYAIEVASVKVGGDAKGYNSGVTVETGGQATVQNATGTGPNSIGAYIGENSMGTGESSAVAATITVLGDAKGASTGALASNFGKITVRANAIGTEDSGARAAGGAAIYIEGDATGYAFGAYAIGELTNISIAGDAVATSDTEPQGSGYGVYAIEVASVKVGGEARGYNSGVTVETGGQATVKNATGTGPNSIGATIGENSMGTGESNAIAATITVLGDAKGTSYGALANSFGKITVGANAIGEDNAGAFAFGGGVINIEGDARGGSSAARADGKGSRVDIEGNAVATSIYDGMDSAGAHATDNGCIHVSGDITGYQYGILVEQGSSADAAFDQLARVEVDGSVSATSSSGIGVANRGALAIVGGEITAPVYVRILPPPEGIPDTYIDLSAEDSKDQPENMGQDYKDYAWYYFENEAKTVRHSFTLVIGDGAECAIGSKRYDKLFDALSEVRTGETIKMLKDARYEGALRLSSGKSFTIDLNGKTVDIVSDVSGEAALTVINKSGISLKGSGEFNVTGVTAGVEVQTAGTVTITNATATDGYGAYIGTNGGGGFITVQKDAKGSKNGAYAESAGLITVGTPDWHGNAIGETEAGAYARNGGQIIVYGDATGKQYGAYSEGKDSRVSVGQSAKADGDGSTGAYAKDQGGITVTHNAEGAKYGVKIEEISPYSGIVRPLDEFTWVRVGGTAKTTHAGGTGVYNQGGIVYIDTGIEADNYIVVGPQELMLYPTNDVILGIGDYKDWPKTHIVNEYDGQFDDYTWYYYQHFLEDGQGNPILDEEGNKKYDVIHSYTVVNGDHRDKVCEIVGGTQFTDLEKALEEIKRQEPDNAGKPEKDKKYAEVTLRLLKDIDYPNGIYLKNTKLTIDANGRNFNFGYGLSTTVGLHMDDSTLNVTGDGEVRASGIEAGIQLINGSKAMLTGARSGTGVGAKVFDGSTLNLTEDARGLLHGVYAEGNNSTATVKNALADSQDGVGALARGNASVTVKGNAEGGKNGAQASDWTDPGTGKTTPGGVITVEGNAEGGECGVAAYGKDSKITVKGDATGTGMFGIGAYAESSASVTVNGDARGEDYGAYAKTKGSVTVKTGAVGGSGGACAEERGSVTVNGSAIGTAPGSFGASAQDGGKVTVKDGAQGQLYGAFASGKLPGDIDKPKGTASSVDVKGSAIATAPGSVGAYASSGGSITVSGDAKGAGWGASAMGQGSKVTVTKDALATDGIAVDVRNGGSVAITGNAIGISGGAHAEGSGSKVKISQNVTATDEDDGCGIESVAGAEITVSGDVTSGHVGASSSLDGKATIGGLVSAPINIVLDEWIVYNNQFTEPTTKEGYLTYTNGESTIWVRRLDATRASITGFSLNKTELPAGGGQVIATLTGTNLNSPGVNIEFKFVCGQVEFGRVISNNGTTAEVSFIVGRNDTYDFWILPFIPIIDGIEFDTFAAELTQNGLPVPEEDEEDIVIELPDATQGSYYCCYIGFEDNDTAFSWRIFGQPSGLVMDGARSVTGHITGITYEVGDFEFIGTITDDNGNTIDITYRLTVKPESSPISITSAELKNEKVGENFEVILTAEGGVPPYTWSALGLPDGVTINAQTGIISGIPAVSAFYPMLITVEDAKGSWFRATLLVYIEDNILTDAQSAAADAAALTWDVIKGSNASPEEITENLNLPMTGANGSSIEWSSINPAINNDGTVVRPDIDKADSTGVLYAFVSKGGSVETVVFDLTVQKLTTPGFACQIGPVGYATLAEALAAVQSGQTIKLLQPISHSSAIVIDDMDITLDLDRFNLVVDTGIGRALEVINGGTLNLAGTGQFNIKGGNSAVWIDGAGSETTVTHVTGTDSSYAVTARNGGSLTVTGNVTAKDGSGAQSASQGTVTVNGSILAKDNGVFANHGAVTVNGSIIVNGSRSNGIETMAGTVAVDGNVNVTGSAMAVGVHVQGGSANISTVTVNGIISSNVVYIAFLDIVKEPADFFGATTKEGYFTYTGYNSTVWVKEGAEFIPVTGIEGVPATIMAGNAVSLSAVIVPYDATNRTITWSVKDAGTTGAIISGNKITAPKEGMVILTASIEDGMAAGTPYTQDFSIQVVSGYVCRIGNSFQYTSLQYAFNLASGFPGAEIEVTLLRDVNHADVLVARNANIILNLNGFNVTAAGLDAQFSTIRLSGAGQFNINGTAMGVNARASYVEVTSVSLSSANNGTAVTCESGDLPPGWIAIGGNAIYDPGIIQSGFIPGKVHVRGDVSVSCSAGVSSFAIACGNSSSVIVDGNVSGSAGGIRLGGFGMGSGMPDVHVKENVYAGTGWASSASNRYAVYAAAGTLTIDGSLYGTDNLIELRNAAVSVGGSMRSSSVDTDHVGVYLAQPSYVGTCTSEDDIRCVIKFGDNIIDTINGVLDGDASMPGYYLYSYTGFAGKVYAKALPGAFVPVTDIELSGTPDKATAGVPLRLAANVVPADATNKTVTWSVKDAGTTGATVGGGNLHAKAAGTVVLTAAVAGGVSPSESYMKDITITVYEPVVAVTGIAGVPTSAIIDKPLTLSGAVVPDTATYKNILWSLKDAGSTGAALSGNMLSAQTVGTAVVTATIANGLPFGEPFTQDFRVDVVASEYFCMIGNTPYTSVPDALAAVPAGGAAAIKLLQPNKLSTPVVIDNKSITFDLNGFDMEIDVGTINNSTALEAKNRGNVYLEGAGEFNVTGRYTGVRVESMCNVTISNATCTGSSSYGASVSGGGWLTVTGNVTGASTALYSASGSRVLPNRVFIGGDVISTGGDAVNALTYSEITIVGKAVSHNNGRAVFASGNAKVNVGSAETQGSYSSGIYVDGTASVHILGDCTINGRTTGIINRSISGSSVTIDGVYSTDAINYIDLSKVIGPEDFTTPTTKPGYLTYIYNYSGATYGPVWIKDPGAEFVPVKDITGVPLTAEAGQPLTLTGTVAPDSASHKAITWSIADAGATGAVISGNILTTTAAGNVIVTATITDGLASGVPYTKDFTVRIDPASLEYVCEILGGGRYTTLNGAIAAIGAGESQTIRLLKNIYTDVPVLIDNVSITFDMNGFDIELNTSNNLVQHITLDVKNGGNVYMAGAGKFNVTGSQYSYSARIVGPSEVTLSNIMKYPGGYYEAAHASGGAKLTVTGNVTDGICNADGAGTHMFIGGDVIGTSSTVTISNGAVAFVGGDVSVRVTASQAVVTVIGNAPAVVASGRSTVVTVGSIKTNSYEWISLSSGAKVFVLGDCSTTSQSNAYADIYFGSSSGSTIDSGGEITINGAITSALQRNVRTFISGTQRYYSWDELYTEPTTKPGYKTYSVPLVNGVIWVKEPDSPSRIPVVDISGVPNTVKTGEHILLVGTVIPSCATSTDIRWSVKDAGTTEAVIVDDVLLASSAGRAVITARVINGIDFGIDFTKDFVIMVYEDLENVCEVVETGARYKTLDSALAGVLTGESMTIRLLQPVTHRSPVVVENKRITFDLSGFNLVIDVGSVSGSTGLAVRNNGKVYLKGEGEFNVTGFTYGVLVEGGSEATVTNATSASTTTSTDYGARASGGGKLTVRSNVRGGKYGSYATGAGSSIFVNGNSTASKSVGSGFYSVDASDGATITVSGQAACPIGSGYAVFAVGNGTVVTVGSVLAQGTNTSYSGILVSENAQVFVLENCTVSGRTTGIVIEADAEITIDGIYTTDSMNYLSFGYPNVYVGAGDFTSPSTKAGYLTYTIGNEGSVWIRDPASFEPVTNITGVPNIAKAGTPLALTGTLEPPNVSGQSIGWSVKDAGTTGAKVSGNVLTTTATGTVTVTATIANGAALGTPYTQDFTITVKGVQLDRIAVSSLPMKTTYTVSEALDLTGIVVKATYDNGTFKDVTGYISDPVNGAVLNEAGTKMVTVSYTDEEVTKTAQFTITVNEPQAVLSSITVTTLPAKTAYTTGEALDLAGMVVKATYSNGSVVEITGYTSNPADGEVLNSIGSQIVTITYTDDGVTKTAAFPVAVSPPFVAVTDITGITPSVRVGMPLTFTGIVAPFNATNKTIVWSVKDANGTGAAFTGNTLSTTAAGTLVVTATIENGSAVGTPFTKDFTISANVLPANYAAVTNITGVPTIATVGIPLTLTGTASPVNATYKDIIWSIRDAGATGATITGDILEATAAGTVVVTATIAHGLQLGIPYTQDFTITVNAVPVVLESIAVTTLPTKDAYIAGEHLDLTGMIVTASYSDNSTKPVTGYTTDPTSGTVLSAVGSQTVTVSYTEEGVTKTTSFTVTVNAAPVVLESIAVTTLPTKTTYTEGENLDLAGMVVKATYSNGDITDVTASVSTNPADGEALSTADTVVTVSYTEGIITRTAAFPIKVNPAITVTGVTVSPDTIEVQKGNTQQFTAMVTGTNNPAQTVTWELDGYTGSASTISDSGLLTVGTGETETTLIVKATSTVDTSKLGAATVSVTTAPPTPIYGISADKAEIIFPAAFVGYGDQGEQSITVSNTGNQPTGQLTVSMTGYTTSFILSKTSIGDIAVGGSGTFTVKPATSLGAGTHTAMVTISGGNSITASVTVSFTVNPVVLESIEVTSPPTKTTYTVDESLDLTGIVVTASYSDSSSKPVTGYTASPMNGAALTASGIQTVTVSYTEGSITKTTDFTVTVNPAPVILDCIAVTTPPTKTTYTVGEALDLAGMIVTASYSDTSTKPVIGYTTDPENGATLNTVNLSLQVSVSYTEDSLTKTAGFTIAVNPAPVVLDRIAIDTLPTKTAYTKGEALNLTGMVVKATYSNGNVVDVTALVSTTPANDATLNTVGQQTVAVSYTDGGITRTADFFVTVSNPSGGGDPTPTVTTVTVSPPTADVQKGGSQQFAATVNGTNNPSQSVTWSVSGNSDAGTDISDTGLLAVANGETAATITVRATSVADTSISGTATVTVTTGTPTPTYSIALDAAAITFPSAYTGYGTQNARTVTVTNTGNQPTGGLTIALSGDSAGSFSLNKTSIGGIAVGGNDSFTVAPKTGLARGTYSATVTVSGSNGITANCTVSFTANTGSSGGSDDSGDSDSGGSDDRDTMQTTPPANIDIDNGGTPLSGLDTPDNKNPDTGAPQTGDANNALGWIIILAVSAFGFFGTLLWRKRRQDKGTW